MVSLLWILIGLVCLVFGGEFLVRGASSLASMLSISPLVIGLTVVAFGTSAPELAVGLQSAMSGEPDLAVGNVVGSNIANILLILGLAALIGPLTVASQLIRIDVPLMIFASFWMLAAGWNGNVGRWEGIAMFAALLVYITWLVRQSRKETAAVQEAFAESIETRRLVKWLPWIWQIGFVLLGLALLSVGARWLVYGATKIALQLGVNELVIGLTVVAIGTSLPEIVTSITAAFRGHRDLAVGNVVGSNLFNILCVLGLTSVFAPEGVDVSQGALHVDIPIMIAVAVACLPIFFTGNVVSRWEGGLFFAYYIAYTTYIVLAATHESIARTMGVIMGVFVLPLTCITIGIFVYRGIKHKGNSSQ